MTKTWLFLVMYNHLRFRILGSTPTECRFAFEWTNPVTEWNYVHSLKYSSIQFSSILWNINGVFPFSSTTPSFVCQKILSALCADPWGCPFCFLFLLFWFFTTESGRYLGYSSTDFKDLCSILVYIQYTGCKHVYIMHTRLHIMLWLCNQLHLSHLLGIIASP